METFSNREIAGAIWIGIFVLWSMRNQQSRKSIGDVLKSFFNYKIQILVGLMLVYVSLMFLTLYKLRFWTEHQIGTLVVWVTTVALFMLFKANRVPENYFKHTALESIKFITIIDFLIHAYGFSLPVELVFVPLITILGALVVFSSYKEYSGLKWTRKIMGLVVLFLIARSIYLAVLHYHDYADSDTWRELILSPLMTLLYLPFIYILAVYMVYESLFLRVGFRTGSPEIKRHAKMRIFSICHLNLAALALASPALNRANFDSKKKFDKSFRVYLRKQRRMRLNNSAHAAG